VSDIRMDGYCVRWKFGRKKEIDSNSIDRLTIVFVSLCHEFKNGSWVQ
jgi:hypothetical protein